MRESAVSQSQIAVITTWLEGQWPKGGLSMRYVFATLGGDGEIALSSNKYSTVAGARRAARKRGLRIERYVAPGHAAAKRRLASAVALQAQSDHTQELAWVNSVSGLI